MNWNQRHACLLVQHARPLQGGFTLIFSFNEDIKTWRGLNFAEGVSHFSSAWYFLKNIKDNSRRSVKTPESVAIWRSRHSCCFSLAEMPVRAVTTRFMYKGLCTIPDVLSYRTPVNLPEDEVEGERCFAGWLFRFWFQLVVMLTVAEPEMHAGFSWKAAPWRAPAAVHNRGCARHRCCVKASALMAWDLTRFML